ncbi:6635_t:CDS:2 [Entrophospora sp. SA101]|nr:6635_t:CDS:2 [Entrophospora sp. SA101]
MTAPQNPIARAIWDGALPIKFSLDTDEAEALGVETIESYFVNRTPSFFLFPPINFIVDDAEIWYDVDGTPLKW